MVTRSRVRECTPGGLGRCTVAALAEAHKVINRPRAKTDRIVLAPFNLPSEPIGSSRTGYQLIMCARATTAPSCSGFTIDQIGAIMRHARPHPPEEDHLWRDARRWRSRSPHLLLGLQMQPLDGDHRRQMARSCA